MGGARRVLLAYRFIFELGERVCLERICSKPRAAASVLLELILFVDFYCVSNGIDEAVVF